MNKRIARLACTGVAVIAVAVAASAAEADQIQTLTAEITPNKLEKKKPRSVQLFVDIATGPNTGAATNQDQPPNASRSVVDFPKNLKVDTSKAPRCKGTADDLENTTPEQAIEICGRKSIISVPSLSSSHVTADLNPAVPGSSTLAIEVVLTAFNGHEPNTLYFHNRADAVNTTTILREKLKKTKGGGPYGSSLITNIPPILAGAPDDFRVAIKKGTIISATCKSRQNPFRLTTKFIDWVGGSKATTSTKTTCKRKQGKKKK